MIIPKHWAKACVDENGAEIDLALDTGFIGVGWSDMSPEDAHRHALERARRIARWYVDDSEQLLDEQYYSDRPLREPVIGEMEIAGQQAAVVTQNIYGAYVLNTAEAMFIDIDVEPEPQSAAHTQARQEDKKPGFFSRLFGGASKSDPRPVSERAKSEPPPQSPADLIRSAIEQHAGMGVRVYRTPNGYRGLVTHQPYLPGSPEAEQVLASFRADKLYMTLCRAQHCFRARLTPKPWRIGMDNPPKTFPFTNTDTQKRFDRWMADYEQRSLGYAACEPMSNEPWGNPDVHDAIEPVMAWHDSLACKAGMPLA